MAYTTQKTIIESIKDGDNNIAWDRFYDTYKPLIRHLGLRYELQDFEIDELISETMYCFYNASRCFTYDSSKGKFRTYLGKIIRNNAFSILKKRKDNKLISCSNSDFSDEQFEKIWYAEWGAHVEAQALAWLKLNTDEKVFDIFYHYVILNEPASQISQRYGCENQLIYDIKYRLIKRIKLFVAQLREDT